MIMNPSGSGMVLVQFPQFQNIWVYQKANDRKVWQLTGFMIQHCGVPCLQAFEQRLELR